ncbi:MAG TPA: hypothetical protein VGN47_16100 [Blastococcus sp.]|jgi:hypothetical protein|nr:hypothetical protein [Blastococcus sp.]
MTTRAAGADENPRRLLADSRRLTRQVRAAQRATWFPLLVFSAVTFAAIPVYRLGRHTVTCRTVPQGRICTAYTTPGLVYWPIALVLAYVVIAGFYLRRARDRGIGTRVFPYAVAGIALAVVLFGAAFWAAHNPPDPGRFILGVRGATVLLNQLAIAGSAIGLALLVLALVERNGALVTVAVGYVAFALLPARDLGWVLAPVSPWFFLPRLLLGGALLLVAGLLFAAFQRPRRRGAA